MSKGLRYYYLRDPQSISLDEKTGKQRRGAPIACLVSHYDAKTTMVNFAIATGVPNVSFDKKLFRAMAEVRLRRAPLGITFDAAPTGHEITKKIMTAIAAASDACKLKRRTESKKRNVNAHSNVSAFTNYLRKQVAEGKKLFDVLDAIEVKSSDWRQKISERTGMVARTWLAQADVPKDTIQSPPPEMNNPLPAMKAPPVPSITSSIMAKVDKLVAANKR